MEQKYKLLTNVLNNIMREAPTASKVYYSSENNTEGIIKAKSLCLIHLFLKVRFGLLSFVDSDKCITDGADDGGLDAYYIDEVDKKIYLIQSKFVNSYTNFESKSVDGYELLKLNYKEIVNGDNSYLDKTGKNKIFNGKILGFQRALRSIENISRYNFVFVYLGNIKQDATQDKLKNLTGDICSEVEIISGKDFYSDVLFPYLQSNYYSKSNLVLKINVKEDQFNKLKYKAFVDGKNVVINMCFIPTLEIAKIMSEYRNALLKYNPRCYVGVKKGGTNEGIISSIKEFDSNQFSVLNNGLTITCSEFSYSESNGEKDLATLQITSPQIVNGGQTAFTLAYLLEKNGEDIFKGKDVIVKFLTLTNDGADSDIILIEKISKATNNQTPLDWSDKNTNNKKLIDIQKDFFDKYGILLERKTGEFFDALESGKVEKNNILSTESFLRLVLCANNQPSNARSYAKQILFKKGVIEYLNTVEIEDIFFLYSTLLNIQKIKKDKNIAVQNNSTRYGTYAVLAACFNVYKANPSLVSDSVLSIVLSKWSDFELTQMNKISNSIYNIEGFNFDNYYKGSTLDLDIIEYFKSI